MQYNLVEYDLRHHKTNFIKQHLEFAHKYIAGWFQLYGYIPNILKCDDWRTNKCKFNTNKGVDESTKYTPFVLYIQNKCNNRDTNRDNKVLPPKDFWYDGCF